MTPGAWVGRTASKAVSMLRPPGRAPSASFVCFGPRGPPVVQRIARFASGQRQQLEHYLSQAACQHFSVKRSIGMPNMNAGGPLP